MPTNIKFPVACFDGHHMTFDRSLAELTTCTTKVLRRGWYGRVLIVDAGGTPWTVKSAAVDHTVGPFWGFDLSLHRWVRLKLVLDAPGAPIPLERIKQEMVRYVEHERARWDKLISADKLESVIRHAETIPELYLALDGFFRAENDMLLGAPEHADRFRVDGG